MIVGMILLPTIPIIFQEAAAVLAAQEGHRVTIFVTIGHHRNDIVGYL